MIVASLAVAAGCGFEPGTLPRDGGTTMNDDSGDASDMAPGCLAHWLGPAWMYRRSVTIAKAMVDTGPFTAFPVLVDLGTEVATDAQADGDDIALTLADGTTRASHELERANTRFLAWVKTDITATADTTLYVYYGNPNAANQQSRTAVWSDTFIGVWHMAESPASTPPQIVDSSPSARHATTRGGMGAGNRVDGRIGSALAFDGSNDGLDAPRCRLD